MVCAPSTMIVSARCASARSHSCAASAAWNAERYGIRSPEPCDARRARLRRPAPRIAGGRDRARRGAVVAAVRGEYLVSSGVQARHADRVLDRFGATVGEEHTIQVARCDVGDQARRFAGRVIGVVRRDGAQRVGLRLDRGDQLRVLVSDVDVDELAGEIEPASAVLVPEVRTLPRRPPRRVAACRWPTTNAAHARDRRAARCRRRTGFVTVLRADVAHGVRSPGLEIYGNEGLLGIVEGLELQRVARRIEQEHRHVLPGLALQAQVRLFVERDVGRLQALGQRFPGLAVQVHAEMRNRAPSRHRSGRPAMARRRRRCGRPGDGRRNRSPGTSTSLPALRATDHVAVEVARLVEVAHRKSEVELRDVAHDTLTARQRALLSDALCGRARVEDVLPEQVPCGDAAFVALGQIRQRARAPARM